MEHAAPILQDLALVLCVAALTALLCLWLRQPLVLGYLLAGALLGPHLPFPLLADASRVEALSELGVVLLMFSVGLEFSLGKLARVLPSAGLVAIFEVTFLLLVGTAAGTALGWHGGPAFVVGAMMAISSTMLIAQVLRERPVERPIRELIFGVLVVEDLAAILLLVALAAVGSGGDASPGMLLRAAGRLAVFLGATMGLGLLVVPRIVRAIVTFRRSEVTTVAAAGLSFAGALAAREAGYSVALGAFLAGALVAESGASGRVEQLVQPLKDVLGAVFFVAVGMLIEPAAIAAHWPAILALGAVVVAGKVVAVSLGAFLAGHGIPTSLRAGMTMAQVGEFSFIIAGAYAAAGGDRTLRSVAVAVATLTAFTTPLLVRAAQPVASWVDARLPRPLQAFASLYGSWLELVRRPRESPWAPVRQRVLVLVAEALVLVTLLVGAGLLRPRLTAWLAGVLGGATAGRLGFAVLTLGVAAPFVVGVVRLAGAVGRAVAERAMPRPLRGVDNAASPRRVLMGATQFGIVLTVGTAVVAATQPFLPGVGGPLVTVATLGVLGVGFWQSARDLQGHLRAGAEVAAHALAAPHRRAEGLEEALHKVEALLPGIGELTSAVIAPGSPLDGRTLGQVNLRGRTGATVVAVVREDGMLLAPTGHELLRGGDVLALSGSHEAIEAARGLLVQATA